MLHNNISKKQRFPFLSVKKIKEIRKKIMYNGIVKLYECKFIRKIFIYSKAKT